MANNNVLQNAALAGAAAGMLAGKSFAGQSAGEIASITAAALAFAVDIDAAIPNNALIAAAGGEALAPATDDIQQDTITAVAIMKSLCYAAWAGKGNPGAASAGAQAALVATVAAQWTSLFAARLTP